MVQVVTGITDTIIASKSSKVGKADVRVSLDRNASSQSGQDFQKLVNFSPPPPNNIVVH